jgi:hypothetical protein
VQQTLLWRDVVASSTASICLWPNAFADVGAGAIIHAAANGVTDPGAAYRGSPDRPRASRPT